MHLYTSHYAAGKLIHAGNLAAVRISIGAPRFALPFEVLGSCKLLMPRRDMLKLPIDEYRKQYLAILDGHGVASIRDDLARLDAQAGDRDLVLLCFEALKTPGEWCHRRMFAEWWTAKTGESVPELHGSHAPQKDLFD